MSARILLVLALMVTSAFALPRIAHADTTAVALNRRIPAVNFDNVTLEAAVGFLRDVSGANLVVDWSSLEEEGINRAALVNLRLDHVRTGQLLDLLLAEAGGGTGVLTWYLEDNVVTITSQVAADRRMVTRVYYVEDLIMDLPQFAEPPDFAIGTSNRNGAGAGGGGLFGGTGGARNTGFGARETETRTKQERGDELVQLIRDIIRPDIWRANGGPASIRYWRGNLIITAPRSVHIAVGGGY